MVGIGGIASAFVVLPLAYLLVGWVMSLCWPDLLASPVFLMGSGAELTTFVLIVFIVFVYLGVLIAEQAEITIVGILMKMNGEYDQTSVTGGTWYPSIGWIPLSVSSTSSRRASTYIIFAFIIISGTYLQTSRGRIQLVDNSWLETIGISLNWTVLVARYGPGVGESAIKTVSSLKNLPSSQDRTVTTVPHADDRTDLQSAPIVSHPVIASRPSNKAIVNTDQINIRTGPSKDYPLIAPSGYRGLQTLGQGDPVVILSQAQSGWVEIEGTARDGTVLHGYVNLRLLAASP